MKPLAIFALCAIAVPLARPADTDSIESTVKAVYATISGPSGPRDWARFRSLFADGGRLIAVRATTSVMTPDEYIQRASANMEKNGFFESAVPSESRHSATSRMCSAHMRAVTRQARSRTRAASIAFSSCGRTASGR
jgi:hypothetical protein